MKGKIGIVTGGASGIGEAVTRKLVNLGAIVFVADRDEGALSRLTDSIAAGVFLVKGDIVDAEFVDDLVRQCVAGGGVDFLVNAAGIVHSPARIADIGPDEFDRVQSVNLKGTFLCYRATVNAMLAGHRHGSIVNVASTAGVRPVPYAGAYAASKHAVVGLSITAALELAPQGIRVNTVCPGVTDTPLFRANLAGGPAEAMIETIPMRRLGRPEEVAEAIVWLLGDSASYVTGAVLPVDGGVCLV